jgi:predicted nucleic acid-binding Zn ribbon protein
MDRDRKPPIAECEWCSKPMTLWVYAQRFCSRQCGDQFHAAERRQAVALFRAQGMKVRTEEPEDQHRVAQGLTS